MSENSIEGVCYYEGTLPLPGVYADDGWLARGDEPGCLFVATVIGIVVMLAVIGMLLH